MTPNIPYPLIIPCAGDSKRMGEPKGLVDRDGKPWLIRQVEQFRAIGGEKVCIVFNPDEAAYRFLIPQLENMGCLIAENLRPEFGPFSSFQTGVVALEAAMDGVFFLPVDCPVAEKIVWEELAKAIDKKVEVAIPFYKGKGGHPVLIAGFFLMKLLCLACDDKESRLDIQIRNLPDESKKIVEVEDSKILLNLNSPTNFQKFKI